MLLRKIIIASSSSSFHEKRMVLKTFVLPVLVLFVRRRSRSKTPHLLREYNHFYYKVFVVILKNESIVIPS